MISVAEKTEDFLFFFCVAFGIEIEKMNADVMRVRGKGISLHTKKQHLCNRRKADQKILRQRMEGACATHIAGLSSLTTTRNLSPKSNTVIV